MELLLLDYKVFGLGEINYLKKKDLKLCLELLR